MSKKAVDVYPDKITYQGFSFDNRTVIQLHLHTDLTLSAGDTLALNLTDTQAQKLYEDLGSQLNDINK
ncbi:hypothetical protein ACLIUU_001511 [Citrobacter werkmanii]|uniref:hypothetical protein n=1 Tax=Citrobacter werkmanii TaxID=67827 RepID=UPI001577413F|nr:hypothetical protein [Citrobacter werkmanii]EKV4109797.1 hypothetical protein [Citrobacter freundii]NTY83915.1 hypothetical protein [Citrobacter werkmanii]HBH6852919.1 hypothetical protein [Citrobacter freundii]